MARRAHTVSQKLGGAAFAGEEPFARAALGGTGGLIAVAPSGEYAWGFTTPAMYRGVADANGRRVAVYADDR